jgi:hypothetical protein
VRNLCLNFYLTFWEQCLTQQASQTKDGKSKPYLQTQTPQISTHVTVKVQSHKLIHV